MRYYIQTRVWNGGSVTWEGQVYEIEEPDGKYMPHHFSLLKAHSDKLIHKANCRSAWIEYDDGEVKIIK